MKPTCKGCHLIEKEIICTLPLPIWKKPIGKLFKSGEIWYQHACDYKANEKNVGCKTKKFWVDLGKKKDRSKSA